MATKTQIHVGDSGIDFIDEIRDDAGVVDLTLASNVQYKFQRPDGTWFLRTGLRVTPWTNGQVRYSTVTTDFDQPGTWKYQVFITIGPDEKHTDIGKFRVYANIPLE